MARSAENVYAQALFELCIEQNSLDGVFEELTALKEIFDENFELLELLSSPSMGEEDKHSLIKNIFEGKVSETVFNFLNVLSDHGRAKLFDKIFEVFT